MDMSQMNCETSNTQLSESQLNGGKVKWDDYIFTVNTVEECEKIFGEYCEERIDLLANQIESKDNTTKLSILRSCIELLNRLEGTNHHVFAGRVLIFLARVIPFYDQSGVNMRSDFSTRELPDSVKNNLKIISERDTDKIALRTQEDLEEGETRSDDSDETTPQQIDPLEMYEQFWKAQQLLSQPNQLFVENNWKAFKGHIDELTKYFKRHQAMCKVWKLKDNYMTEPRSFFLQLNDKNMRRCFLVQILIVLQYLELPVESRPDSLTSLDKTKWISSTKDKIYNLLGARGFSGYIHQVLNNEKLWNKWKNDKCQEPKSQTKQEGEEEEIINMGSTYRKRRKISDELQSAKPYNRHVIGSLQMSNLWNERPNQIFNNKPDLAEYFKVPQEKQAQYFKDPNTSFRILRLLRKSPYFFVPTVTVIQSLDNYLLALADKGKF